MKLYQDLKKSDTFQNEKLIKGVNYDKLTIDLEEQTLTSNTLHQRIKIAEKER